MMTQAFEHLGHDTAREILTIASNPFVGLFVGLLITALIQSSSTSTAMVIALVAANTISMEDAIPIVMGANIGTTLTSTIVAFGYISKKKTFRRAISAAMLHDFFNIITVAALFPLELKYHFLSSSARWLTKGTLAYSEWLDYLLPMANMYSAAWFDWLWKALGGYDWLMVVLSFVFLFASVKLLSKIIYEQLIARPKHIVKNIFFNSTRGSFSSGLLLTSIVQSSSITTSLAVPLVATGKVSLRQVFPFVMGSNVGTTITAFIAAYSHSEAALSIAFVHFLFNAFGAVLLLPFRSIRAVPERLSYLFGRLTMANRLYGFLYIILTFFLVPFFLIYISS